MNATIQKAEDEIKNLKDDLPEFNHFVIEHFENKNFQIDLNYVIETKGLKGLILKIAQKIIYKIIQPIVEEQNAINNIFYLKIKQIENKNK